MDNDDKTEEKNNGDKIEETEKVNNDAEQNNNDNNNNGDNKQSDVTVVDEQKSEENINVKKAEDKEDKMEEIREEEEEPKMITCGNQNQYNVSSISGCTIFALEAAIQLLLGKKITSELVDEIINIGAGYNLSQHIELQELIENVPRFSNVIKVDQVELLPLQAIRHFIEAIKVKAEENTHQPIVAILIKPPETIMIGCLRGGRTFVLFDSHPRDIHPTAAFLSFQTMEEIGSYLSALFPICALGDVGDLQSELFDSFEINYLTFSDTFDANQPLSAPNFWVFEKLQLHHQIASLTDQVRTLNLQLQNERSRCQALEFQLSEMLIDQLRRQGFH